MIRPAPVLNPRIGRAALAISLLLFLAHGSVEAGGVGALSDKLRAYFNGGSAGQVWTQQASGSPHWAAGSGASLNPTTSIITIGEGLGTVAQVVGPTGNQLVVSSGALNTSAAFVVGGISGRGAQTQATTGDIVPYNGTEDLGELGNEWPDLYLNDGLIMTSGVSMVWLEGITAKAQIAYLSSSTVSVGSGSSNVSGVIVAQGERDTITADTTSPIDLPIADTRSNEGASSAITYNLPPTPAKGTRIRICCEAAQYVKLAAPNDGTVIRIGGTSSAAGGFVRSNVAGSFIEVEYASTHVWKKTCLSGTWTMDQ